jgi:hypothetical protein
MATVTINGISYDTDANPAADPAVEPATRSRYLLIAARQPIDSAVRNALDREGAVLLEAVPGGAFICRYPLADARRIAALPFIDWVAPYPVAVKLSPALLGLPYVEGGVPAAEAWNRRRALSDGDPMTVDVVLHRMVDPAALVQRVAAAAGVEPTFVVVAGRKLRVTLQHAGRARDVAALDEVRHLDTVRSAKGANSAARTVLRTPPPGSSGSAFTGLNETICIADTGFDKGILNDVHPAFKNRVKKLYALARAGLSDDPSGHGTHVAGSALGDGLSEAEGLLQGTAPGADLVVQSVGTGVGTQMEFPASLEDLLLPPYSQDKARIHSNSWVRDGAPQQYLTDCEEIDRFVYEHRDLAICCAAGNDGDENVVGSGKIALGSVRAPGTAKNCITVGASENDRPSIVDTWKQHLANCGEPLASDLSADNPEGMAAISSRGPTADARFKPDVVAPGTFVLSARSRKTTNQAWSASSDPLYMFDGGTSMSTALVAGCAASVRHFLRTGQQIRQPSAALVKAALINGARPIRGQYRPSEAGTVPNNVQGFGRVDLQAVVGPYEAGETVEFFDEDRALETGEDEEFEVALGTAGRRLKVTLVWTDPPGESLQCDLDLIVRAGNRERHGNKPAASTRFDRVNNVEQVDWANVPQASATVIVRAHSVPHLPVGPPAAGAMTSGQSYALVVRVV